MRQIIPYRIALIITLICIVATGCIKDSLIQRTSFYKPVYKSLREVRQNIASRSPQTIKDAGQLFYKDGYVYLNEKNKGVHVINIKNPKAPVNETFIELAGCTNIAVRGNTMYADQNRDLIAVDIADPKKVKLTAVLPGVFANPWQYWVNDTMVIVDWVKIDTVLNTNAQVSWGIEAKAFDAMSGALSYSNNTGGVTNGVGGSMARYALLNDRLYTIDSFNLRIFNTSNPASPSFVKSKQFTRSDIETIFPFRNNLFFGAATGMHIYDVSDKDNPEFKSVFTHARVCDPVVANENFAYVTLRSGTRCAGFENELDVLDISNVLAPKLLSKLMLKNPHGLSVDGKLVLVCDQGEGVHTIDVTNASSPKKLGLVKMDDPFDVIALDGIALVTTKKSLTLIDYSNAASPVIASKVAYEK